jgi:hypothetical protein
MGRVEMGRMSGGPVADDHAPRDLTSAVPITVLLLACLAAALLAAACGGSPDGDGQADTAAGLGVIIEETGSIESADTQDPDHAGLRFDGYTFDARLGDTVEVSVEADGFTPLLKLTEVATGAVLAEWEAEHSDDEALTYTIAGPGTYEARVYALDDGTGTYRLTVTVDD